MERWLGLGYQSPGSQPSHAGTGPSNGLASGVEQYMLVLSQ